MTKNDRETQKTLCNDPGISPLIVLYLFDRVPAAHQARLDAHLFRCDACIAEVATLQPIMDALKQEPEVLLLPQKTQYAEWKRLWSVNRYGRRSPYPIDYEEATKRLERQVVSDPHDAESWLCLGYCYTRLGNYVSALKALKKTCTTARDRRALQETARWRIAHILWRLGHVDETLRALDEVLRINGRHKEHAEALRRTVMQQGRLLSPSAINRCTDPNVGELFPLYGFPLVLSADQRRRLEEHSEGCGYCAHAFDEWHRGERWRARISDTDKAMANIKEYLKRNPQGVVLRLTMGFAFMKRGEIRKAIEVFQHVLTTGSSDTHLMAEARWRLAHAYLMQGHVEDATPLLDAVLQDEFLGGVARGLRRAIARLFNG